MSLEDRLNALRNEADRAIPVPAGLQSQVKAAVKARGVGRRRRWHGRWLEVAAACLILGSLVAIPLFRPAKPVPAVTEPVPINAADLVTFHMSSERTGWATTKNSVLHTADGGATWQAVTPKLETGEVRPAYFLDGETAWVQESFNTLHHQFYRTTDGGRTWEKSSVMLTGQVQQFVDRDHGWLMDARCCAAGSAPVRVLRTADGGKTWDLVNESGEQQSTPAPGSLPYGGLKHGLTFRDETTGWAAGEQPAPGRPWFFVTRDGGRTWQPQPLPMPRGYEQSFVQTDPPRFFDATTGVMHVGLSGPDVFYTTVDGGTTWQPGSPITHDNALAWHFADVRHGWALDGMHLHITTDGGQTWEQVDTKLPAPQRATLSFVSPTTGWLLTDAGLYKSTDGGRTWAPSELRITPGQ